ncbi:MAG: transcription antitermination factor NusB [Cyanobacteria bacterium P01_E01_bin.45]
MQPRRVARELALLAIGQLPSSPQKLSTKQLDDYIVAAVRSLSEEARESLEVAGEGVNRSERLLNESELSLPVSLEASPNQDSPTTRREAEGERLELARLKQVRQQIGKIENALRTADPTKTSASAILSELLGFAGQMRTAIDSATQSVEDFDRRLQSARTTMAESVKLAGAAINRVGSAIALPEFVQLAGAPDVQAYALQLLTGVHEHKATIDERLQESLVGWNLKRIGRIEQNILRLAVVEMEVLETVPERVAINEAVELAKTYGSDESASFVNGVLRRISTPTQG